MLVSCKGVNLTPEGCSFFIRQGNYEKDEAKHTQVDNITLELGLELRCLNLERTNVLGVVATLDIGRVDWAPEISVNVEGLPLHQGHWYVRG